jgi:DTW domain-containing protein YfiP
VSRRGRASLRCAGCRLPPALCLCAQVPVIATRTRVIVLLHQLEARKTSNTGRLAHQCLPSSELHLRGNLAEDSSDRDDTRVVPAWLERAVRPVLLFPDPDAELLDHRWRDRDPVTLIVPDGTWSQAIRARKRIKGLAQIPCVALPGDLVSSYRLRRDPRAGRVSTMEAIAHALGMLESETIRDHLLSVHRLAVERTLFSKGLLAADEVWGGLPSAPRRA